MSMEHSVTTTAPKPVAKTTQAGGSGHGAGKAQAAIPGDFASLLMGLDGEELVPQEALPDADAAALAALPGATDAAVDPAALPLDPAVPTAGLPQLALPATTVAQGPLQGQALGAPAAGEATSALPPVAAGRAESRTTAGELPAVAEASSRRSDASALADAAAPAPATADEVQPLLRQAVLAQRMAQHRSQATEGEAQAGKERRGDDMAARLGWRISEQLAPAGSPFLAAGLGESGLRPLERRSERSGPRIGGGEAGGWSGVAQPEGARMDVPTVAPDGGLTTEMRVAEQVSYWIGRGAQNAELEVEGLGEGPVKVSIELQGQEARVEFRADQAQTRQVLQDAMPHLRELLEREGLVLSGMSVGTSGSERGDAGQPGQGRQGGRQGQAGVPELPAVALVAAAHRATPLSGRSVDLFV
ncbi:MAG: flagellar hook-length control protein FliK [Hylemonella sp.]|nr:flagellar hook-length control protein FliK [Hylemonella sp.]